MGSSNPVEPGMFLGYLVSLLVASVCQFIVRMHMMYWLGRFLFSFKLGTAHLYRIYSHITTLMSLCVHKSELAAIRLYSSLCDLNPLRFKIPSIFMVRLLYFQHKYPPF